MSGSSSRLLLLSGSPPGFGDVGEIILRDLALHYGPDRIHCVAIVPSDYSWKLDPQLDGLTAQLLRSDYVHARRWGTGKWGAIGSVASYLTGFQLEVSKLVDEAVKQARAANVDRIFAVLNNSLMMAVAHRVADALDLPMTTLVWDPPEYLFQLSRFDRSSRARLLKEFQRSLARSQQVAVVSETMQKDFASLTDAPIHILRLGLPMDFTTSALTSASLDPDEWVIGFAGSMYSNCAWRAFMAALDQVGWRIAGRSVRIKLLAERITLASRRPACVEFLGFRSPEEVQRILSQCHLTYMPQPFVPHLRELCRYAFPTKLSNYLAIGRPVFVHAPAEGALSNFYQNNPIGAHATSLEPAPIIEALEALLGNEQAYREASRQVQTTARAHFDTSVFHAAIDRVLGDELMQAQN
jgi:glycosyltransferase involved in cell wall biosynthesis